MGLLFRIIKWLYLVVTKLIKSSLIDDPYEHQVVFGIANFLIILAWLVGSASAIFLFVWAISLEILVLALLIAYLAAYSWSKFSRHFTPFGQEMYLLVSCVGLTVVVGTAIQIHRLQWADGKALSIYWIFLLILGFLLWGVTVFHVTKAAKVLPVLAIKTIKYKHQFCPTKIPQQVGNNHPAQNYLQKLQHRR